MYLGPLSLIGLQNAQSVLGSTSYVSDSKGLHCNSAHNTSIYAGSSLRCLEGFPQVIVLYQPIATRWQLDTQNKLSIDIQHLEAEKATNYSRWSTGVLTCGHGLPTNVG